MKIVIAGVAALSLILISQVSGQGEIAGGGSKSKNPPAAKKIDDPVKFNIWMDVKLKQSQEVLAGLAEGDFQAIQESTKQLKTLSKIEGFVRRGFPGYTTQLQSFEFAVEEIENQAKKENIEGVALGFQQLTLSCVNCHKQLRQPLAAEREESAK
ncbi:MAG: hypothetical protein RH917_16995 [Lacipirellulaceae bacterium]